MSSFIVAIETDNAAFDNFEQETSRILREIADYVERGVIAKDCSPVLVEDINGNTVGQVIVND